MIEAFFLNGDDPDLFVTYHPPGDAMVDQITIVCPPFFGECQRTQLCLRELSISLATAGQHVVRFDYRGTGDSFGEPESLSAWSNDLRRVVSEARELSGCHTVNLVVVRAAALLLPRWLERADAVGKIVLWDPIWQGTPYIDTYFQHRKMSNFRNRWLTNADRKSVAGELLGFPFPEALARELEGADITGWTAPAHTVAIYTEPPPADAPQLNSRQVRFGCNWHQFSDDILMPGPVLEEIRQCLLAA
ncbi:MAG: hypothetical protein AAFV47_10600 [Pseudomonadota bacterium]